MTIDKEYVNSFARDVVERYEENSVLASLADVSEDRGHNRESDKFVQYGSRVPLSKDIFRENVAVKEGTLAGDFATRAVHSEKNHVLSAIDAGVDAERLETFEPADFSFEEIVVGSSEHVYTPDWLFVPNNTAYRREISEWLRDGRAIREDGRPYLRPPFDIKVEWIPSKWGYSDAYLFDSSDVHLVQKRYKDTEVPSYMKHISFFDAAEGNDRLMTYLGEYNGDEAEDAFEFFYRIVVTKPEYVEFSPYAATIARLPDEEEV